MRKSTSISLSDKELAKAKELMKIYDTESLSELFRILLKAENERINFYAELKK